VEESSKSNAEWIRDALDRYEGPLVRYARRITGDLEQARDVVQDTFLKLCAADRSTVETHLAAWLYTVCRNRALDVSRKERRMVPLDDAVAQTHATGEPPASATADFRDAHAQVLTVVETLPKNQQEVIRLKFQDALSYKEISQVTGLSVTNVGFLLHTAIRNVRARLATTGLMEQA
jgi:RNA polymerase sigma-70 factor (ECF subfamily)